MNLKKEMVCSFVLGKANKINLLRIIKYKFNLLTNKSNDDLKKRMSNLKPKI